MDNRSSAKGITAALISFFFLALLGVCVKQAGAAGGKLGWIVFVQYSVAFSFALLISAKQRFKNLHSEKKGYEFMRGITGAVSFFCYAFAMTEIPLVDASLLQNTAPIFIPIIGLFWLKEKVDKKIWLGIAIGFVGIVLIIKPDEGLFRPGDLFGLISGILLAVAYISMKIITKTDKFTTVLFYYSLIAFLVSMPFGIISWSDPGLEGWLYAIASGLLFIGYLNMLQFAYKHIEPVRISPFNYSVVVFMGLFDWWLFGHVPGTLTIIGICVVSLGGILAIALHEKDNKDLKHTLHS